MVLQKEITLAPRKRGIHLVTGDIQKELTGLPSKGIINLLIKHTSAALALNENADPDVRSDLASIFDRMVPTGGRLNLGMWQGIYLCEFRDYGGPRKIVVTVIGE